MTPQITIRVDDFRIVPYVRMTQRGKFVKPEALRYLANQEELRSRAREQWEDRPMVKETCTVEIQIGMTGSPHKCDLDNQIKAVLDALKGVVYDNDNVADDIRAARWKDETDWLFVTITDWSK